MKKLFTLLIVLLALNASAVTQVQNWNQLWNYNAGSLSNLNANFLTGSIPNTVSLSATQLTGTVDDARLSANVPLLNANQAFSGVNIFNSSSFTLTNGSTALKFNNNGSNIVIAIFGTNSAGVAQSASQIIIGDNFERELFALVATNGNRILSVSNNGTMAMANGNVTLSAAGALAAASSITSSGNIVSGAGFVKSSGVGQVGFTGRALLYSSANGFLNIGNSAGTSGNTNLTLGLETAAWPRFKSLGDGSLTLIGGDGTSAINLIVSGSYSGPGVSTTSTNTLIFTTVSVFTNTLGRDAYASFSAGNSIILQDTNGNTVDTLGTIATLHQIVPMRVNMRASGTGMSAILY